MKSQWWSYDELRRLQMSKLSKLLEFVYRYVPYYRNVFNELKIQPRDFRTLEHLKVLPIIDKTFVNDKYQEFVPEYQFDKLFPARTSGSSGENLIFQYSLDYLDIKAAANYRSFKWAGQDWSDRTCELKAPFDDSGGAMQFKKDPKLKRWYINTANLDDAALNRIVDNINDIKPDIIGAYTSLIYLAATFIRDKKKDLHKKPKAILTTGEIITDKMRDSIETIIGAKIYDWYGNTEGCASAAQCEHGSYHINSEYCLVESIEKNHSNHLVGTNLVNLAFPLIRYDTGDIGELLEEHCPCGRELPLMKPIAGRKSNFIYTPSGKKFIDPNFFSKILKAPIKDFQIIQDKFDSINLLLVKKASLNSIDLDKILTNLKKLLGEQIKVDVRFVEKIERSHMGKYQMVISKL
jgi:phenylacetate-CoA ligase